MFIKIYLTVV